MLLKHLIRYSVGLAENGSLTLSHAKQRQRVGGFFRAEMRMRLILTEAHKRVLSHEKLGVIACIRGVGFLRLESISKKYKFDINLDLCIGNWK